MIGVDTNVLIRHLTQDDPVQSPKATQFIEQMLTADSPGFVSIIVMAETVWVLERSYGQSNVQLANIIERVLQIANLRTESEQVVFEAMVAIKQNRASFADALIGALHARAGCTTTVTFDRRAARLREFELL
jgi:predicted nucleic-acid-binding protein